MNKSIEQKMKIFEKKRLEEKEQSPLTKKLSETSVQLVNGNSHWVRALKAQE